MAVKATFSPFSIIPDEIRYLKSSLFFLLNLKIILINFLRAVCTTFTTCIEVASITYWIQFGKTTNLLFFCLLGQSLLFPPWVGVWGTLLTFLPTKCTDVLKTAYFDSPSNYPLTKCTHRVVPLLNTNTCLLTIYISNLSHRSNDLAYPVSSKSFTSKQFFFCHNCDNLQLF